MADVFQYVMTEWVPVRLGDGFEDRRQCKPCGLPLLPEDQARVLSFQVERCHCAMTALNLEALGPNVRTDVSLELLSSLRDGQVYDEARRFVLADERVGRQ